MSKPSKSEQARINTLRRELLRKRDTAHRLEVDLNIAGRDYDPYIDTLRDVRDHLKNAVKALERIAGKGDVR
ncbi:MAG: hypothetical protein K6T81_09530 [Alicyclobacillus macrosporangiidus]|uniref:hypothetical protein n=1 Tax=Alicyclobacillus macrosporangiidus TaxID=392015 RepID=UPI0026F22ED3|nr:hypothetical protein [Alicyclobacillus macrosporangiidus]MCL6598971.1 hypothetical protein [Alicyclobacillus macrosporangiidus]